MLPDPMTPDEIAAQEAVVSDMAEVMEHFSSEEIDEMERKYLLGL